MKMVKIQTKKIIRSKKLIEDLIIAILMEEGPMTYYEVFDRILFHENLGRQVMVTQQDIITRMRIMHRKGVLECVGFRKNTPSFRHKIRVYALSERFKDCI